MNKLAPYWKAVVGFISPGVVATVAAVQASSPGGQAITFPEWVGIAAACILTGTTVFAAANTPKQVGPVVDPAAQGAAENAGG